MDIEDLEPRKKQPERKNLEIMSVEALHAYITELEAEIARTQGVIASKEKARTGADRFFKR
ncbi:MAG: DUF1192 domain-containing protein [Rhodospirillales bacterium]|nr:DUF1192 domain-containing protein [Rhodospirillales bacterium]